jgi:hypothetical protein
MAAMSRLLSVLDAACRRIDGLLPGADIRLSGGALLEGDAAEDLDLVVLVGDVPAAAQRLRQAGIAPLYEEDWRDDWAAFREAGAPQVDMVLTKRGTKGEAHHLRAWDALLTDRALLAEYRALEPDRAGYETRKAAFFERIVAALPREP